MAQMDSILIMRDTLHHKNSRTGTRKIQNRESKTVPNSATQKTREKVRRKKSRGSILITEVEDDGNHFFRRGWKRLSPVNTSPMPLLPLDRPWKNAVAAPRCCKTIVTGLPKPATPYMQARQEGKKWKKQRKWICKKCKRLPKVMIYFAILFK